VDVAKRLAKARFDWLESARELAIVVAGVLVALLAQEVVQDWQWDHKVAVATAAMRDELLSDDGPQIYQRAAMHPCVLQTLDRVREAVERGRSRAEIGKAIDGYWVEFRTFDRLALDSANSSDIAAHMPQDQLRDMTRVYQIMPLMERTNAQEGADLARLRAFRRTGSAVSDAEKDRVLEAVEALRSDEQIIWLRVQAKLPLLMNMGPLDQKRVQHFMANARQHYGTCVKDLPADWPNGVPVRPLGQG
jgi:hypothetical protein